MISIPADLTTLSKQQIQELAGSCTQDIMRAEGIDYITAWNRAKTQYKNVFDEIQKRGDAERSQIQAPPPILSNDDLARIALTTPSQENCLAIGLNPSQADYDEYCAAAKGAKDLANPDFEGAFNALSSFTARKRGLSNDAADQQVAASHPNLKKKADMQKAARQITQGMPAAGQGFQRDDRPSAAPAMFSKPLPDTTPGPVNTGKTGLGFFKAAADALGNEAVATAPANSNDGFVMISDSNGWHCVN
jgi:hypothetical protein